MHGLSEKISESSLDWKGVVIKELAVLIAEIILIVLGEKK